MLLLLKRLRVLVVSNVLGYSVLVSFRPFFLECSNVCKSYWFW